MMPREFNRSERVAGQIRYQLQDAHDQIAQLWLGRKVSPPRGQINAGQHNLVVAPVHQTFDLVYHDACRHGPRIPAAIGNDAEGTAMVTTVLHLHIGAAAGAEPVDQVTCGFRDRHDIVDLNLLGLADEIGAFHRGPGLGLHLLGIADDKIDLDHRREGRRFRLRRATGHDHLGVGVVPAQLADLLLGFPHGL